MRSFWECLRSMISIYASIHFEGKATENIPLLRPSCMIPKRNFSLYIFFAYTIWTKNGLCRCEKTTERFMYASVKCDFEWNFFQIQMTNSTNFENGHELSLIWISDRVNILCIFVTVHPSVWESVNAYRVSLAQWLKSTSNDMPEALTRARLPGGNT